MPSINDLNQLSQPEFAQLLGVSTRTIQRNPNLEKLRHGAGQGCYYVWSEFWTWLGPDLSQNGDREGSDDKRRKEKAEADIAEMKRDQLAGTLVDAQEVRAAYCDFLARLRTNIRGLPDRLVPRLEEGSTLQERLSLAKELVDELLRDVVAEEESHE